MSGIHNDVEYGVRINERTVGIAEIIGFKNHPNKREVLADDITGLIRKLGKNIIDDMPQVILRGAVLDILKSFRVD